MRKTIKTIKRLANSSMGNPAFEITFTTGQAVRTKANISDAYIIHAGMEAAASMLRLRQPKAVGNALSPSITRGQSNE